MGFILYIVVLFIVILFIIFTLLTSHQMPVIWSNLAVFIIWLVVIPLLIKDYKEIPDHNRKFRNYFGMFFVLAIIVGFCLDSNNTSGTNFNNITKAAFLITWLLPPLICIIFNKR